MDKKIKCVVWDLDNTLWKGILSEGDEIVINDNVLDVIKAVKMILMQHFQSLKS